MLDIIGFFFLCFIMFCLSVSYLLFAFNGFGQYNLGGAVNKSSHKVILFFAGLIVLVLWYLLFSISPFEISIST